jgi:hypothetical protein
VIVVILGVRVVCHNTTLPKIATVAADRTANARPLAVGPAGRLAASYTSAGDTTRPNRQLRPHWKWAFVTLTARNGIAMKKWLAMRCRHRSRWARFVARTYSLFRFWATMDPPAAPGVSSNG